MQKGGFESRLFALFQSELHTFFRKDPPPAGASMYAERFPSIVHPFTPGGTTLKSSCTKQGEGRKL